MSWSVSLAAGLLLAMGGLMNASAAATVSEDAATGCHDKGSFVLPDIPWMGKFAYKISVKPRSGLPETVEVETVRGPDLYSNRTVTDALQKHVKASYVCEGASPEHVFYMVLDFPHEVAALAEKRAAQTAAWHAKLHAAAAASAAAAQAADLPAGALVPLSAGMVCTAMGKPYLPRVQAVGKMWLHVVAEVTDGKVTLVDAKIKMGSTEPGLNKKFIEAVERTMRDTYQCPGNHVFEQEFMFTMS